MGKLNLKPILNRITNNFRTQQSNPLTRLQKELGYFFNDSTLLNKALTHRSYSAAQNESYETLEFLGDAVIDLIISEKLIDAFPKEDEGFLTVRRASLVNKDFLGDMGDRLNLQEYIKVDASIDMKIDKIVLKQCSNVFEAVIGGMYLDGGYNPCEALIEKTIWKHRSEAWSFTNYKGKLFEYCNANQMEKPEFIVTDTSGPDHNKEFEIMIKIGDTEFPPARANNKKAAEQKAAHLTLSDLILITALFIL